jgi:hypothetical protein
MKFLTISLLFSLLHTTLAVIPSITNCPACVSSTSLLSSCGLDPLDVNQNKLHTTIRNVTGVSNPLDGFSMGPTTETINTTAQAGCICTHESLGTLNDCLICLSTTGNTDIISLFVDCVSFGYHYNTTLGGPTTTASSLPINTALSSQEAAVVADCGECRIVAEQLAECGLPGITSGPPPLMSVDDIGDLPDFEANDGYYLHNRKSAECFCTQPVNDRLYACFQCAGNAAEGLKLGFQAADTNANVLRAYLQDCTDLGYYPDKAVLKFNSSTIGLSTAPATSSSAYGATGVPGGQRSTASQTETLYILMGLILVVNLGVLAV